MDSKKKGRPITSFFERKTRQVHDNETTESQVDPLSVSSDANGNCNVSACTGKESGSAQTSFEASSPDSRNLSPTDVPEKLHQPKLNKFPLREVGKQKRAFNPKWFDQFKFLHCREGSDSVVCHTWAIADKRNLLNIDTKKERTFIETGFSNWKKAIEKFRAHASSAAHIHAT